MGNGVELLGGIKKLVDNIEDDGEGVKKESSDGS
jgi:hypothetical protein